MATKYICSSCGAKRLLSKEMHKMIDCLDCDGFAILEGSNVGKPEDWWTIKNRNVVKKNISKDKDKLKKEEKR